MAIRRGNNVRRATPNTVKAMRRNAASKQCPTCGRKNAMRFIHDWGGSGIHIKYCYWAEERKMCSHKSEVKGLGPEFGKK